MDKTLPDEKAHPLPWVHSPTDTGPFVEALVLRAPPGTTMLGTSGQMSFAEYVELWGEAHGVKTRVNVLSLEDAGGMLPGGLGREVGETGYYIREYGWEGGEGAVLPQEAGVELERLTSPEKYIRETDWSSVLA